MEIIQEAFIDTYMIIPFLFIMYITLSYIDHSSLRVTTLLQRINKAGPCIGALLGIIPQCGFSVVAATLYIQGGITVGTLVSVFIATSDEMIPLFLLHPEKYQTLLYLIIFKVGIAIIVGYIVDLIFINRKQSIDSSTTLLQSCEGHHSLVLHALYKILRIYLYLFITTLILSLGIEMLGERLQQFLLNDTAFQPVLTSIFGFLPNCAASVILTQLYMQNSIGFASLLSGLITNAGLGFIILFKQRGMLLQTLQIVFIIFISALICGITLNIIM